MEVIAPAMPPASSAAVTASGDGPATAFTGKADQHVPIFDNVQRNYREYRKRCELYKAKMDVSGRSKETVFNLVTLMTGKSWDLVDDLSLEVLQSAEGFKSVFDRLDRGFKFDALTELPEDFENYFVRLSRRPGQTLQDYSAEHARAERRLRITHEVDLPEKVKAWWYLRKSGINREQRQLVLTNVGSERLTLDNVQKAMNFILGQDSKVDSKIRGKVDFFYQDDEPVDYADLDDDYQEPETAYWQEAADEVPWPDYDQDYYIDEDGSDIFDVEEYDEVFASYQDAKTKLNPMRASRGFYPVVALIDRGGGSSSPTKGRGKKGKMKGKSKGKQGPISPKGGTAKARGRAAVGRQVCLRCGQSGHWARNCPSGGEKKRKAEGESNMDDVNMVAEVFSMSQDDDNEDEPLTTAVQDGGAASVLGSGHSIRRYLLHLLEIGYDVSNIPIMRCKKGFRYGNSSTEVTEHCLLMPVVLGGRLLQVLTYVIGGTAPILFGRPLLERLGVSIDYAEKKMKFEHGTWQDIPTGPKGEHLISLVDDKKVMREAREFDEVLVPDDYQSHVDVETHVPFETLFHGLDVGAAEARAGAEMEDSEILMNEEKESDGALAKEVAAARAFGRSSNVFSSDQGDVRDDVGTFGASTSLSLETPIDGVENVSPKNTDTEKRVRFDMSGLPVHGGPERVKALTKAKMHSLILSATDSVKEHDRMIKQGVTLTKNSKLIWEVFAGRGRTSEEASKYPGVRVETFSQRTGWDFLRAKDRRKFLRKMREEVPDEIMFSPMCRLWSPLQELSLARHPGRRQKLVEDRKRDHDEILTFVAVAYECQRKGGRHAHIEHPWESRAWVTKAFSRLRGFATYVDQCEYGLTVPGEDGKDGLVKKPTCFLTTKESMHKGLAVECSGGHQHIRLEGNVPGQGPRSKMAENYPPKLARMLAKLMVEDGADDMLSDVMAAGEEPVGPGHPGEDVASPRGDGEVIRKNAELKRQVGPQVFGYVARLHKSLGHPSAEVLLKMLEEVQATEEVKKAAKEFICGTCYARKMVPGVPPAAGLVARRFNDRLVADSAWIDTTSGRRCILTLMCQATRYVAVRLLASEKATDFIKGVERAWIKQFGVPKYLRVDEAKGWASQALRDWTSDNGIVLEVAPAECHSWLGSVERKHQVVRRAVELFMDDRGERNVSNLKDALVYIPGQVNNMSFVRGFTPNQWVTGRSPIDVTSLSSDVFNPGAEPMDSPSDFSEVQKKRLAAQEAFIRADTDAKLRRAMNKNYHENHEQTPGVGQSCWYWRIQGSPTLQKAKWRGPARVVAHEQNDEGKVTVVWVAHGTNLLRCGPHQVRPLVQDSGCAAVNDPHAALDALKALRARSTTQFRDVFEPEPVMEDILGDEAPPRSSVGGDVAGALPDWNELFGDADEEPVDPMDEDPPAIPGAVSLLYQRFHADDRPPPQRRRHSSTTQPLGEPDPEHRPDTPPADPKRPRLRDSASSLSPGAVPAGPVVTTSTTPITRAPTSAHEAPSPHEVPLPDPGDDELLIDDVQFVDGATGNLPDGWAVVDGDLTLDEVWLSRAEAREKDMTADERAQMIEAKMTELTSYFRNAVWEFEPAEGVKDSSRTVTARWVLTWKHEDGRPPKAKARLVLRGFQDPDLMDLETASPTASRQAKFLVLAIAPVLSWTIYCGDVKTAFLSGATFGRKIIVRLPSDCGAMLGTRGEGPTFMRLLKSAYGLADAPLLWWKEADRRLREGGWKRHVLDRCLYCMHSEKEHLGMPSGSLIAAIIIHVDDLLLAGLDKHPEFQAKVVELRKAFDFGKWHELTPEKPLVYCGGKLEITPGGIRLSYSDYLKRVTPITMEKNRKPQDPLNDKEITRARGLIGALQWPAVQGVPPLAASLSIYAADINKGSVQLITDLNKTLRFAKGLTKDALVMKKVVDRLDDVCFLCYSDAAFGVRSDHSSQGGYIIVATSQDVLKGGFKPYNVVSWRSFKLTRVCRSSLAAEAQACAAAADELMMVKTMLSMMVDPSQDPRHPQTAAWMGKSALIVDARALYDAVKKKGFTSQHDKRSAIEIMCIQQELDRLQCDLRWVSSERMLADGLTKVGARIQMSEQLRSGGLSIFFDETFQAAKKKTVEQRGKAAAEAFGTRVYGSRTARKIAQVLAIAECAHGAEASSSGYISGTEENGSFVTFCFDHYTLAFLIGTITIVVYVLASWCTRTRRTSSTASTSTTATSTSSTATTPVEAASGTLSANVQTVPQQCRTAEDYEEQIKLLLEENEKLHSKTRMLSLEIREHRGHVCAYEAEIKQWKLCLERERREHNEQMSDARRDHQNRLDRQRQEFEGQLRAEYRPRVNPRAFVTPRGRCYHVSATCGHIRGHDVRTLDPCRDCSHG